DIAAFAEDLESSGGRDRVRAGDGGAARCRGTEGRPLAEERVQGGAQLVVVPRGERARSIFRDQRFPACACRGRIGVSLPGARRELVERGGVLPRSLRIPREWRRRRRGR